MKRMTNKIIAVILTILMLLSVVPMASAAAVSSGECGDNATWTLDSEGTLTISGRGYCESAPWRTYLQLIKKVVVEEGICNIYQASFYEGRNISVVTLPSTLFAIGSMAFESCDALKTVNMPQGAVTIGSGAFEHCSSLENISIGDGSVIGEYAFYRCSSLKTVNFGKIKILHAHAFDECENLTDVNFSGSIKDWYNVYERYFYGDYIPLSKVNFSVEYQPKYERGSYFAFGSYPQSIVEDAAVIEQLNAAKENWIYIEDTYKNTKYAEVELGGSKYRARLDENLENAVNWFIYEPVFWKVIDPANGYVFADIAVDSRTYCSSYAQSGGFGSTDLKKWLNEDFYTQAFTSAERNQILTTTVKNYRISMYDWSLCEDADTVETIFLPSLGDLTNGTYGFSSYPDSPSSARTVAYSDYSVNKKSDKNSKAALWTRTPSQVFVKDSGTISDGYVSTIESELGVRPAMYVDIENIVCSHLLKEAVTPPTCTADGYSTLSCKCGYSYTDNTVSATGHSYVSTVTVKPTHTETGVRTYTCHCGDTYTEEIEKLKEHTYSAAVTAPTCTEKGYTTYTCKCGDSYIADYIDANGHSFTDGICTVCSYIEILYEGEYTETVFWKLDVFGTLTVYGDGKIPGVDSSFGDLSAIPWMQYAQQIKKVVVSDGITEIGENSFFYLELVEEAEIAGSVRSIDECAFYLNFALKKLTLEEGIEEIGNYAFRDTAIEELYIPASVKLLGLDAFGYNSALKSVHIGNGGITILEDAFNHCVSLERVYIENCRSVHLDAFCGCSSLKSITILSRSCEIVRNKYIYTPKDVIFYGYTNSTFNDYAVKNDYSFVPVDKSDDYVVFSGSAGENAQFNVTAGGSLNILGEGETYNKAESYSPFINYHNHITELRIENGITSLGIFTDCDLISVMYIPASVTCLSKFDTFRNCKAIKDIYYYGTEAEWAALLEGCEGVQSKANLSKATVHYNYCPDNTAGHSFSSVVTVPTCNSQGYTTHTCGCGYFYLSDYTNNLTHSYSTAILIRPTHTSTGTRRYLCTLCSDYYTETIPKLTQHTYIPKVTAPTCTEEGYTTYTCACGDSYVSDYVGVTDHTYTPYIVSPATHTADGVMKYACSCGDYYTEVIPKYGNAHSYTAVVTAPTCTEKGYTTYTCVCTSSYVSDYTDAKGHSYESKVTVSATHLTNGLMTYTCTGCSDCYTAVIDRITAHDYKAEVIKEATHLTEGEMKYTCICGSSYTEVIETLQMHTYDSEVVSEPTCTANGKIVYYCECGYSFSEDIGKLGHIDTDDNSSCDRCGVTVCDHICHQDGFMGFIWKIINFFQRLFGISPVCECGAAHY